MADISISMQSAGKSSGNEVKWATETVADMLQCLKAYKVQMEFQGGDKRYSERESTHTGEDKINQTEFCQSCYCWDKNYIVYEFNEDLITMWGGSAASKPL